MADLNDDLTQDQSQDFNTEDVTQEEGFKGGQGDRPHNEDMEDQPTEDPSGMRHMDDEM